MTRVRRRLAVPLALVLALGLAFAGALVVRGRADASVAGRCRAFAAAHRALAAAPVTGAGRRIAVIGDSWAAGYKLHDPRAGWPSRLPGRVSVDGFSGSGFSAHASPCGAVSYAERASSARGADLVVVEGGLNDVDQSHAALTRGFRALVHGLGAARLQRGSVLIVGPAPAPSRRAGARRVDRWLATLSADAGVPYLSAIHLRLPYLRDRLHLTPAGHRAFGDFVAAHLP